MKTVSATERKRQTISALALALVAASAPGARASDVHFAAAKSQTISLAGGFAALQNPLTAPPSLYSGVDPLGTTQFSFPVIFDSGASGNLLSNFTQTTLNIPLTGQTYQDVGIGGTETFNVTPSTRLLLAPIRVGEAGADDITNYTAIGNYKFQAKQQDVNVGGEAMPFDLIGTPVLRNKVLHVEANNTDFSTLTPFIDYMRSDLEDRLPQVLPSAGVFHIPLQFKNFIDTSKGAVPVSTGDNPVIPGIQVFDSRKNAANQSKAQEWLLDTGGSVTIIGRNYAAEIGIDLVNETPVNTVDVFGVGGEQRTLNEYILDHLSIPLANGDHLVYDNFAVFVPADANTLPADLGGIFGVNNLAPSFDTVDPLVGPSDTIASPYSDWYLNGPGNELVLVNPNSTYVPEPMTPAVCIAGWLLLRRRRKVNRA